MRLLLDENLPHALKALLTPHEVFSVQDMGWRSVKNGALIARAEGEFDVFITADKNLRYQQNLKGRRLAILELPTNRKPYLIEIPHKILAALEQMSASGELYLVTPFE